MDQEKEIENLKIQVLMVVLFVLFLVLCFSIFMYSFEVKIQDIKIQDINKVCWEETEFWSITLPSVSWEAQLIEVISNKSGDSQGNCEKNYIYNGSVICIITKVTRHCKIEGINTLDQ